MPRLLLVCVSLLGIVLLSVLGEDRMPIPVDIDELTVEIDAIAMEYVQVGAMIGVIDRNQDRRTFSYGSDGLHLGSIPLHEDSLFDIGSITKTFTCLLLADMGLRGLVDPGTPVSQYLPRDRVTMPTFDDSEIELIHLATHTSGLPRGPQESDYPKPEGFDPLNQYAAYTTAHVYKYLTDYCSLEFEPGTWFGYSNTGMGLLGHVLGLIDGTSFAEVLQRSILDELGMASTFLLIPEDRQDDLARGHNENSGYAAPYLANDIFQGAGFLKSSLADMFSYLEANIGLSETPLRAAMDAAQQSTGFYTGSLGEIGLGWFTQELPDGQQVVWHGGRTTGYGTYIGFNKDLKTGVIVLCNFSVSDVATEIGERILQLIPDY
ncbi:serine hydrolase domain-containing protein [Candidatus Bipolaricaulota bacterium]